MEDKSMKIKLFLATFAPALFGCIFYVVLNVPVLGDVWWIVAPFALLLYWCNVGKFYRELKISYIVSVIAANLYGIVSLIIYMILYYGTDIVEGERFVDQIIFWFSYPLQFLTSSVGMLIHHTDDDAKLLACTQIYGVLFMVLAFSYGWWSKNNAINKERRKAEKLALENRKIHEATHPHR